MSFEFNTLIMTLREDSATGYTILSTNYGMRTLIFFRDLNLAYSRLITAIGGSYILSSTILLKLSYTWISSSSYCG